jgi:hypothetical protein
LQGVIVSSAVFETMQSAGAKIFSSRMYASLAVKSTQILPAMPVRMTRRGASASSSVSSVVSKNPECFGFRTK